MKFLNFINAISYQTKAKNVSLLIGLALFCFAILNFNNYYCEFNNHFRLRYLKQSFFICQKKQKWISFRMNEISFLLKLAKIDQKFVVHSQRLSFILKTCIWIISIHFKNVVSWKMNFFFQEFFFFTNYSIVCPYFGKYFSSMHSSFFNKIVEKVKKFLQVISSSDLMNELDVCKFFTSEFLISKIHQSKLVLIRSWINLLSKKLR